MYFPTSEQTSMQPEWQISLPSEPGHESTSASFSFFFLLLPPSFFFSPPPYSWKVLVHLYRTSSSNSSSSISRVQNLKSDIQHSIFFFIFHWLIFHTLTLRQTRTSRHLLTFVRILFTDKSEALIDVYESFLPSRKGRRRDWRENVFYIIWDENLFTASVPRDRVRVYCKSNIFPRVRDIEQDRL